MIEIDAASHGGVDDVRDLRDNALLAPAVARKKIYIIDEAHMVSTQGWNAFLKTVEEPPEHVIFVFATTEPHKVLPTIVSRCQRFDFRRISSSILAEHLAKVCAEEGVTADEGALALIARAADGGARDALSTLDQLAISGQVTIADTSRLLGTASGELLFEFTGALLAHDAARALALVARLVDEGHDIRTFAREVVEHARWLLLVRRVNDPAEVIDATPEAIANLQAQSAEAPAARVLHILRAFADALTEMRAQAMPRLALEIAVFRVAMPEIDDSAASAVARIERLERLADIGTAPAPLASSSTPPVATTTSTVAPAAEPPPPPVASAKAAKKKPEPATEPAPEAVAPPPPTPHAPHASDVGLEHIRASWTVILEDVKKQKKVMHSRLMDALIVGFADGFLHLEHPHAYHAEGLMEPKTVEVISGAIERALGIRVRIAATVRPPSPEDAEPTMDEVRAAEEMPDPLDIVKAGFGDDVIEE